MTGCAAQIARRANHYFLSSLALKNILIFRRAKSVYVSLHPVPTRGALRNVINVGRVAVDAEGSPDKVPEADGKNV
jgi:hypothetical protein